MQEAGEIKIAKLLPSHAEDVAGLVLRSEFTPCHDPYKLIEDE